MRGALGRFVCRGSVCLCCVCIGIRTRSSILLGRNGQLRLCRQLQRHGGLPAQRGLRGVAALLVAQRINRQMVARACVFIAVAPLHIVQGLRRTVCPGDGQGVDGEWGIHPHRQHQLLQRLGGFAFGFGGTRIGDGEGTHMQVAQLGGAVAQGGPVPGDVGFFQRDGECAFARTFACVCARCMVGRIAGCIGVCIDAGIVQSVHQFVDMPAAAQAAAYAFHLQAAARRHVALHETQQGVERFVGGRPEPQPAQGQRQHHQQPQRRPQAVTRHAPRQAGTHGCRRGRGRCGGFGRRDVRAGGVGVAWFLHLVVAYRALRR